LCAQVVRGVLADVPDNVKGLIEDFVLGCSFPEGEQGLNIARLVAGQAGLPVSVAGQTVNRFCSSGLQAVAIAANAIMAGQQKVVLAGGVESMSVIPMGGSRQVPSPELIGIQADYYMGMGMTAENVADKWNITRDRMDAFGAASHAKAKAGQDAGRLAEEIIPVQAIKMGKGGMERFEFKLDEGIRAETTAESLGKLRPVFKRNGKVTAGNSSQMTDGASALLLMELETAKELGLKPLVRFVSFAIAGVEPGIMGIGPIEAVPRALKLAGIGVNDLDVVELNEAFAAQALACMDVLKLNPEIVNPNGGAIALGHPLGCTGAALTTKVVRTLQRTGKRYGMVSMCVGAGQGAAGIFERM
jgi:acetyl-CoA acyltransferase